MASQIIIQRNRLAKKGQYIHIDLKVCFPPFFVKEDEYMTVTPLLREGENRQELPSLLVNGKRRHKGYKQIVRSLGKDAIYSTYNIYKAFNGNKSFQCNYSVQVHYENWMDKARIEFIMQ